MIHLNIAISPIGELVIPHLDFQLVLITFPLLGLEQLSAVSSIQPAWHDQLTTIKSPLPTHHLQVVAGQFNPANSPQRQLAVGSWKELSLC